MSDGTDIASETTSPESHEAAEPIQDDERLSTDRAQNIIERLLPKAEERKRILAFFTQSIRLANQLQPAS